jgi:hypothetical protein
MDAMIYPQATEMRNDDSPGEVFDNTGICPPFCDERSIYNT